MIAENNHTSIVCGLGVYGAIDPNKCGVYSVANRYLVIYPA